MNSHIKVPIPNPNIYPLENKGKLNIKTRIENIKILIMLIIKALCEIDNIFLKTSFVSSFTLPPIPKLNILYLYLHHNHLF